MILSEISIVSRNTIHVCINDEEVTLSNSNIAAAINFAGAASPGNNHG